MPPAALMCRVMGEVHEVSVSFGGGRKQIGRGQRSKRLATCGERRSKAMGGCVERGHAVWATCTADCHQTLRGEEHRAISLRAPAVGMQQAIAESEARKMLDNASRCPMLHSAPHGCHAFPTAVDRTSLVRWLVSSMSVASASLCKAESHALTAHDQVQSVGEQRHVSYGRVSYGRPLCVCAIAKDSSTCHPLMFACDDGD